MSETSMGEKIRDSISFLSFMGEEPDLELIKEVRSSFFKFTEKGSCTDINKVAWKIYHRMAPKNDFSFIRTNQMKFVCSILLINYTRFYKSRSKKHVDVMIKLMDMMIGEAKRDEIDQIVADLNLEYYMDRESMLYVVKINQILEMNPDEFTTCTMDSLGFD